MRSPIYWSSSIYHLCLRLMFGKEYNARYQMISKLVPEKSSVVDVCCGDCALYRYLEPKVVSYVGLDLNEVFVSEAKKKGIDARNIDILSEPIPEADVIIMQSSLYQFIPRHGEILRKMYDAARSYLIVSESLESFGKARSKHLSSLAHVLTDPGNGAKLHRFTKETLEEALAPYHSRIVKESFLRERERVVMIDTRDAPSAPVRGS